jgi:tRNA dimethylallyltransferase
MNSKYNLITILGHTAAGKTSVATNLASRINGEIISGDSRQVYRGMDLGTGKDLEDYIVEGKEIPYHLIDIADPGYEYNVYEFQHDFFKAFGDIVNRGAFPVLCGGTGLYVESVIRGYDLPYVPANEELRATLKSRSLEELTDILKSYRELHNTSDTETIRRAIRAIEIEEYLKNNPPKESEKLPAINSLIIGVKYNREVRRQRITERLKQRIEEGMIEEVKGLIDSGVDPDKLIYYGLEYKYLTLHVMGELSKEEMFDKLNIAIHQFAKRQMTWFRRMERNGIKINWLPEEGDLSTKIDYIQQLMNG